MILPLKDARRFNSLFCLFHVPQFDERVHNLKAGKKEGNKDTEKGKRGTENPPNFQAEPPTLWFCLPYPMLHGRDPCPTAIAVVRGCRRSLADDGVFLLLVYTLKVENAKRWIFLM